MTPHSNWIDKTLKTPSIQLIGTNQTEQNKKRKKMWIELHYWLLVQRCGKDMLNANELERNWLHTAFEEGQYRSNHELLLKLETMQLFCWIDKYADIWFRYCFYVRVLFHEEGTKKNRLHSKITTIKRMYCNSVRLTVVEWK